MRRSSDDHNVHDLVLNVHRTFARERSRTIVRDHQMNVRFKIVNVMIVGRTFIERSVHERERSVLGGHTLLIQNQFNDDTDSLQICSVQLFYASLLMCIYLLQNPTHSLP